MVGQPDVENEMTNNSEENQTSKENNGKAGYKPMSLTEGQHTSKGEDLLTECIEWFKKWK